MTIMAGSMSQQAGRNGAAVESLHLDLRVEGREATREWHELLKPPSPLPVINLLQKDHIPSTFPDNSINWGPSIHIYEPMGVILIQTTTKGDSCGIAAPCGL